ncbi:MAG: hypothetical protein ABI315_02615 [Bacteroidia bacterium]
MNPSSKYLVTAIFIFAILFSGCKKKSLDYRTLVSGDWNFHYSSYNWTMSGGVFNEQEGDFKGKISYKKKNKDVKAILINYMDGITTTFELDKEGNLTCCGGSGKIQNNDSTSFSIATNVCDHAMGGGTNYTVRGKKIN